MYAVDARTAHMLLFADHRVFPSVEERFQHCMFCGKDLVILPDDRRGGACFDCLSLLGDEEAACPDCGEPIPFDRRAAGCASCGWFPGR
jgi:hypothetical protein